MLVAELATGTQAEGPEARHLDSGHPFHRLDAVLVQDELPKMREFDLRDLLQDVALGVGF